jgi:RNA polymerase sigma-70 factor (ECF subfamily)
MEFDQAYKEYFRQIYIFAYRIIGDKNYAMDITQETFVKLHNYMSGSNSLENPRAWLYRVAANISNNHLKRNSIFNRIIRGIQKDSQYDNIESELINIEEKMLVRNALKKLSSKDRTILQLYQDGFSYTEIAEIMNIKKTAIGKTLSRAIEKCAGYIER